MKQVLKKVVVLLLALVLAVPAGLATGGSVAKAANSMEIDFSMVQQDGAWQLLADVTDATAGYYKVTAIVDGTSCEVPMSKVGTGFTIWANFFTDVAGYAGAVPTESFVIEEGAVVTPINPNAGWSVIEGESTFTVSKTLEVTYDGSNWVKTVAQFDTAVDFSMVQSDGTWQFAADMTHATAGYYKVKATIDGTEYDVAMQKATSGFTVWPNFFTDVYGGAVPTESLVIKEGAIIYPVTTDPGWPVVAGADVLKVTKEVEVLKTGDTWAQTVTPLDFEVGFSGASTDTMNLPIADVTNVDAKYYKVNAIVDGTEREIGVGYEAANSRFLLYYLQEGWIGGAAMAESLVIEEGAVFTPMVGALGSAVAAGKNHLKTTRKLEVVYDATAGAWKEVLHITPLDFEVGFSGASTDTMNLPITDATNVDAKYYKVNAIVDGTAREIGVHYEAANSRFLLYYLQEGWIGGAAMAESLVIEEGALFTPMVGALGSSVEVGKNYLKTTKRLEVAYDTEAAIWKEVLDITYVDLAADDFTLYRQENQYEGQGRVAYGLQAAGKGIPADEEWKPFVGNVSVALDDGAEKWNGAYVILGSVPSESSDGWAADSAFLLYTYTEECAEPANPYTEASKITILAGGEFWAEADRETVFRFTEDVVLYKHSDGTWALTEEVHVCDPVTTVKKATTTKDGYCIVKCNECGDVKSHVVYYKASKITLKASKLTYTGKYLTPKVYVKDSKGKTIASSNYTLSVSKRKSVGKYTATITFKGEKYSGKKTLTWYITPKKTSAKLKTGTKKLTASWTKISGAKGYEVQYSTSKKFSKAKTVKVGASTTKKTISKLTSRKTYYVRVRAYDKYGNKASWSSTKSVKVK